MKEGYKVKLRQFCNKFPNHTQEMLLKHMQVTQRLFKEDKERTVKQKYDRYLQILEENKVDRKSNPSYTSWSYVVYCKEPFEALWSEPIGE